MLITNAFTCTGPYAILIMLGIKRVENRNMMPCPAKGRCAVGCSKSFCKEEFGAFVQWASQALPLDDSRRVISAPILVSLGDHRTVAVQVGEVFSSALKVDAKSVIVAHNHPNGDPTPSSEDIEVTKNLIAASELVDAALLDPIVLGAPGSAGGNGYVSVVGSMKWHIR